MKTNKYFNKLSKTYIKDFGIYKNHYMPGLCEIHVIPKIFTGCIPAETLDYFLLFFYLQINHAYIQ